MFDINLGTKGEVIVSGRLDAASAATAQKFLDDMPDPRILDMAKLEYISSAGLGVLLKTQKRLMASGGRLKLVNANSHIIDVFRYSGFDKIFDVESGAP